MRLQRKESQEEGSQREELQLRKEGPKKKDQK
jgi:hypothetical protein